MVVEVPEWARAHIRGTKKLTVIGAHCPYCVVASELGTENGFPEIFTIHSEGFFAVSEVYPVEWRELGVAHEFIEHVLLKEIDEQDRCLVALKIEISIAKEAGFDMLAYAEFRYQFFNRLVLAYHNRKDQYRLVKRLKRSRSYLQDLLYDLRGE